MAKAVKSRKRGARPVAEPRRQPQQARGEQRFEEILDAAEAVIAEVGVAEATTNAIAERAGASMGSMYHFFPNRDAIIRALAARYQAIMLDIKDRTLSLEVAAAAPIPLMVSGIVDPYVQFLAAHPAYIEVYHATQDPRRPACSDDQFHGAIVRQVETLMAARVPATDPGYRRIQATFAVEYVHRMIEAAWSQPPALRQAMIDELKRVFILHCEMIHRHRDPLTEPPLA